MAKTGTENRGAGEKLLSVIRALGDRDSAGVTELAEELSLPKSTVHYHLDLLHQQGLVIKDGTQYRLSLRFLTLGEHVRNQVRVYDVARAQVEWLAEESGELALLMVEEGGMGVYLDKAKGENAIDVDASIGRHAYLHNRALGKAILAFMSGAEVESILDEHGLPETSENTITDRDELTEELATIREREVAFNDQESIDGFRGVGVPILDGNSVLGAISVAGPTARMKGDRFHDDLPELLERARNVVELTVQNG